MQILSRGVLVLAGLAVFLVEISCGQVPPDLPGATLAEYLNSSCPHPPYNPPLPEAQDQLQRAFTSQKRFFVVIGASRYPADNGQADSSDDRPFVESSARRVRDALIKHGYQEAGFLVGRDATKEKVRQALRQFQNVGPEVSVVVYYAGHAVPGDSATNDDLYLQLANERVALGNGLPVSLVLGELQGPKTGDNRPTSRARVFLVIDSCYSGQPLLNAPIWRAGMLTSLVLLTSARAEQRSWPLTLPDGDVATAFGYFFARALTDDWDCTDRLRDGAITIWEVHLYLDRRLKEVRDRKLIEDAMTPDFSDPEHHSMLAYDPTRVVDTGIRTAVASIVVPPGLANQFAGTNTSMQVMADNETLHTIDFESLKKNADGSLEWFFPATPAEQQHMSIQVWRPNGQVTTSRVGEPSMVRIPGRIPAGATNVILQQASPASASLKGVQILSNAIVR